MKQYSWIPKSIERRHEEHGYSRWLHAPSPMPPMPPEAPPEEESGDEVKSRVIIINISSGEEEL